MFGKFLIYIGSYRKIENLIVPVKISVMFGKADIVLDKKRRYHVIWIGISNAMKTYIFKYSLKDLSVLIFRVFCSAHLHYTQFGKYNE